MANLPITGVASSWRLPGHYMQILFGQGPASAGTDEREIVIAMPFISTGTATANSLTRVKGASDVETLAGPGTGASRCARMIFSINKNARVWYLAVAITSGTSDVAADLDITFTTNPDSNGLARLFVCGEACTYSYDSSDTVTTVADGIVLAVNAKTHLPVTAANVAGVVTLTAKERGIAGGDGTSASIRVHADVTAGTAISVATENGGTTDGLGLGTATAGADGTTTQAAALATALATLDNVSKYYICSSAWDATSLTNLQTHVTTKSLPNPGLRCNAITFFPGALAAGQTLATGRNYERLQVGLCPRAEDDPATFVGWVAGTRSLAENKDPSAKLTNRNANLLKKPWDPADWLDGSDLNDAITDGLTVFDASGPFLRMSMNVNTRSKDPSGSVDDFRATEMHRVSTADKCGDETIALHTRLYAKSKLADDKLLPDGTVDPAQRVPDKTVTATTVKGPLKDLMRSWARNGWIQNIDATLASLQVVRDDQNGSRLEYAWDLHVVDHYNQSTFAVSEVSTG